MIKIGIPLLDNCKILKSFYSINCLRYVRMVAKRGSLPKRVQGKVKTVTLYDDRPNIQSYQDLINDMKQSGLGEELEVEKAFVNEDTFGDPLERSESFYQMHLREEKVMKSKIKKQIIKNKYFKLDRETNLLTHAAKEQIRSLHKSNPQEWNPKALSECFPISEDGVKKLLKCNFSPTSPAKIQAHDEIVAERWKTLKSGIFTTSISPLTQKLYEEGKLKDDYFSGNPNLPTQLPTPKVVKIEKKKNIGEFSKIVQTYADHEKQKLLANTENCSENQVTLRKNEVNSNISHEKQIKSFKYASEEFDGKSADIYLRAKQHKAHFADIPFSRFKEILREEKNSKPTNENEYKEILETNGEKSNSNVENYQNSANSFVKISKYDKDKNINAMYERNKIEKNVYKYDNQLGYQHPTGKIIKGNIYLSPKLHTRGKLFKREQCVYGKNGEFLYKVPI